MSDSRIDASLNAPGADNRRVLSSQSQRRRWEAAWLDQQRDAFDVIEYERGDGSTVGSPSGEPISRDPPVEQASEQRECAMKLPHSLLQETSRPRVGVNWSPQTGADSAHGLFQELPTLAPLNSPTQLLNGGGAAKAQSTPASASPMPRAMPPSAVLWLEGESVRSAMRLKDPGQTGETLAALKEWLRDAGLWLREAWVNGRIAFKSGRDHGN